jgi:septal ring factor EnvC (AmiA/AmiB activator)
VLSKGRKVPAEAMEGQTFSGRQAQRFNLAGMVPDRAEAMRRLRVYHAAVDTGARAMSTALEDQLAEARSQIESLQSDNQAQADLLTEASTTQEQLRGEVETLSAQAESLTTQVTTLTTERDSALEQVTALNARVAELEASQADFDAEVARVVASTGHTPPAQVTPAGDGTPSAKPTLEELVAQYDQLVSDRKPEEAAKFFDEHLAQHFNR